MNILSTPIIFLLISIPLFLIGKKKQPFAKHFLLVFIVYVLLDMILTALPIEFPAFDFIKGDMNWSGKIYSYALALAFFLLYKGLPLSEYGLTLKQNEGSLKFAIRTTLVFVLLMLAYCVFLGRYTADMENILFQLSMPSVVEEIVFRGVYLGILGRLFTDSMRIGKINFGMGVWISSLLFGLWHGLNISNEFVISMSWLPFVYTGLIGFVLALVAKRTGSLVFPIIIHILVNIIPQVMGYVF